MTESLMTYWHYNGPLIGLLLLACVFGWVGLNWWLENTKWDNER